MLLAGKLLGMSHPLDCHAPQELVSTSQDLGFKVGESLSCPLPCPQQDAQPSASTSHCYVAKQPEVHWPNLTAPSLQVSQNVLPLCAKLTHVCAGSWRLHGAQLAQGVFGTVDVAVFPRSLVSSRAGQARCRL